MTKQRNFFLILILGSLTALAPFSIDMYLPGFGAIAKSLHTTTERVALSLSSFFIGISFGQLLYGPLLDRFGRKLPLYCGLVVYIAGSAGCYFAQTIEVLIAMRFVQAIGACAATVAAMAMVRDIFPVSETAKVFSKLMLVLSVSPLIAPTVGGYVTASLGWHIIFVILAAIAILILVAVSLFLPESYKPDPTYSLAPSPIFNSFWTVLKTPQFYTYSLCGAIGFSGLFAYISSSPIVYMEVFKVSNKAYGWIFALLSTGLIGASQVNSVLMKKYKSEQIVNAAMIGMVICTAVFLIGSTQNWLGLIGTTFMIYLVLCCVGLMFPNTTALALAPFDHNAGVASSLTGAFQMAFGSAISTLISLFASKSTVPMSGTMLLVAVIALLVLVIGRKNIKTQVEAKEGVMASH